MKIIHRFFLVFLLLSSFIIYAEDKIFWEKERLLVRDDIGKFEITANDSVMCLLYTKKNVGRHIYFMYSTDGSTWHNERLLINDFYKSSAEGFDFSTVVDANNTLYLCYRKAKNTFRLAKLTYPFNKKDPDEVLSIKSDDIIYLPRLYCDSTNMVNLVYTSNIKNKFVLQYKRINDDGTISAESFIGEQFRSALNPVIREYKNTLYILFQAKDDEIKEGYYYNILMARSRDFGRTWDYRRLVTSEGENNQNVDFIIHNKRLYMVWEKEDSSTISHIKYKYLDIDSDFESGEIGISHKSSEAHEPMLMNDNGNVFIFWYDNYNGEFQNFYAHMIDDIVDFVHPVIGLKGRVLSPRSLIFNDNPRLFWIQSSKNNYIYQLSRDNYVLTPTITVAGLKNNGMINKNTIVINWNRIEDFSGLEGYRSVLTRNQHEHVPDNITQMVYSRTSERFTDLEDGTWYYKIKAYDNAGNQSEEALFTFSIDTEPPLPPAFSPLELDDEEGLTTNSPVIEWQELDEKLSGYRFYYKFFLNAKMDTVKGFVFRVKAADFKYTTDRTYSFDNLDNGILLVGIKGYDMAGNLSAPVFKFYTLNDYVPVTYVSLVNPKKLPDGDSLLNITGRGFKVGGDVELVMIDRDKKEPFDYVLKKDNLRIISDRYLVQKRPIDIEDGTYYIGVRHPERGDNFYTKRFKFSGEWVFKYENENLFSFSKVIFLTKRYNLTFYVLIGLGIIYCLIVMLLIRSIVVVLIERRQLKRMMKQLHKIKEQLSDKDYYKRSMEMKRRGLGLTVKYTILILLLVITMVTGTSVTISALALRNETRNLALEMKERANLVLRNYFTTLVDIFTLEKGFTDAVDATTNTATLPDIGFVYYVDKSTSNVRTVVRYGERSNVFFKGMDEDVTNEKEKQEIIESKIFTPESEEVIKKFIETFDGAPTIFPEFDPTNVQDNYIFLCPVIIGEGTEKQHVADIFIGYSFEKILLLINHERNTLIKLAGLVTIIAIIISMFGAVFLATTTIRPIKKMSRHVKVIATSEDYEKLVGTENERIEIKTRDEIGVLASSINEMTEKLIEKAKADKMLMLGKEIQKKFIPLEPHETDYIDIYGFYEGAKGVSGDYFDFKKLDEDHYAFIICDVAGKAVPAALIMVQISTIFQSFCVNFDPKKDKFETVGIVNEINDTVAERGFTGRFAAILVVIFNFKTGKALLTNAGYTQLLVYRKKKRQAEWIKLNADSGAAGVFPSYMLPHPYVQESVQINKGDIILLFTDGIEESRNGKTIVSETGEEQPEEFGLVRIKSIIDESEARSPKQVVDDLIANEKIFRGDLEQYDDLTILGVMRK